MLTSPRFELMAPVAQWIEHLPSKQRAAGSSPAGGTNIRGVADVKTGLI